MLTGPLEWPLLPNPDPIFLTSEPQALALEGYLVQTPCEFISLLFFSPYLLETVQMGSDFVA